MESILKWKASLRQKDVTENMMRWMNTFENICDRDCCFSPDCAVISCSNCFTKLTSAGHPLERFECMECISSESTGQGELCGPTLCSDCFQDGSVLHFHCKFCRISEITGEHSVEERQVGLAEQRMLKIDDFVPWEPSGEDSNAISGCCVCGSEFETTGSLANRRVSPPGCTGFHDDCLFDFNKGWTPIPGAAYCGDCAMQRCRIEGRLLHCRMRMTCDSTKSESGRCDGWSYFPVYCHLCRHLAEMAQWREDFRQSFQTLVDAFATGNICNNAHSLQSLELPKPQAWDLLCACGAMPSCAVPGESSLEEMGGGGSAQRGVTCAKALDVLAVATKQLHPQPYIRDEVDAAMAMLQIPLQSSFFHNEDLIGMVLQFVNPKELLSVALTCQIFLSVCRKHRLTSGWSTSARFFCQSYMRVRWIIDCGCPTNYIAADVIATAHSEQSALDVLTQLRDGNFCFFNYSTTSSAVRRGYFDVLKWLRNLDPPCPWDEEICRCASGSGHLEILQWLRSQDPPCPLDEWVCVEAAANGHLKTLRWLRSQDPPCPWEWRSSYAAANNGHLETLQWLRSQDPPCPWNEWVSTTAAENGGLEMLKWLRSQTPPCPWDENTCTVAASNGYLGVLQWLRSQDPPCPWDEKTCTVAASNGYLEVLQWLRSQDPPCPLNSRLLVLSAIRNGHLAVLTWLLLSIDFPIDSENSFYCTTAASRGHLQILQLLRSQGASWGSETYVAAVGSGDLEMVRYLRSQDPPCPWDERVCTEAAKHGHLEILQWLRSRDPPCPWDENTCVQVAEGHSEVLEWLRSHSRRLV